MKIKLLNLKWLNLKGNSPKIAVATIALVSILFGLFFKISFGEYDESTTLTSGIDGCTISCIEINGQTAYVTEGVAYGGIPTVDVVWTNQRNWFSVITYGMSKEETLKIVLHVKPINP